MLYLYQSDIYYLKQIDNNLIEIHTNNGTVVNLEIKDGKFQIEEKKDED